MSWDLPGVEVGGKGFFWTAVVKQNPLEKPQTGLCLSQLSTAKNMSYCFGTGRREQEPPGAFSRP